MKKILLITLSLIGIALLHTSSAHATSGFDASRIIDDVVLTDTTRMSTGDIQNFLNSKVPTCDTNGTAPASDFGRPDLTHAQYAATQGWPAPPYPCLKDYTQNGQTAAQLINNAAQTYQVNPQVLIVLLQKEQGLVTDTWPLPSQYRSATGYGCPDTAACDSQYYGLTNQLNWAATMFHAIETNSPTWYTPYILGNNYIQYNPNSGCGGSTVNIQNRATQALYNYTPYQPNQAALDAGWALAPPCGAYGNRNFFLYFTDWFGSTTGLDYSWAFAGQYAYTDSTKTTPVNLSTLMPGQRIYVGFYAKNTGNKTWTNTGNNPVRVGTVRDYNRTSAFYDTTWLGYGRPATLQQSSVASGETGSFEFWMTVPPVSKITDFSEYFAPLIEGVAWMQDWGMNYSMRVTPPTYTWSLVGQAAYTDSTKTTPVGLNNLNPGDRRYIELVVKNTSNVTWANTGPNPIDLGTTSPIDRSSAFYDSTWLGYNRAARMVEPSVAPSQNATFDFWLTAPSINQSTTFLEHFTPVAEGITWMNDIGLNYAAQVNAATYGWSIVGQAAYTDSTKTTSAGLDNLNPGDRRYIELAIRNTGNVTWKNSGSNPMDLGTTRPTDRSSIFYDTGWLGYNRSARINEASVAPGQTATFDFWVDVPANATPGSYLEHFTPVLEGITWLQDIGLNYYIKVQ